MAVSLCDYGPGMGIGHNQGMGYGPVGQGTVRRMTQFPVPLLRTNVKPARSAMAPQV